MLSSQKEFKDNVVIQEPLGSSDHNQLHFNINIKSDKTKVKQCRRDFRRGNYEEIGKSLTSIDWNDKMNNKTATECWNIFRGELDRAIDSYVPMKKQGKRYKKKHLSKEAFRKIRYKQNMWRVYKHTGTDKDYDAYKEALNAATNEVRKSKRNFEHKLAQHIKPDSNSFYTYVRSKQNVRDKVGPLEDNAVNIITQGFLMAEELTMHFSSVGRSRPECRHLHFTQLNNICHFSNHLTSLTMPSCNFCLSTLLGFLKKNIVIFKFKYLACHPFS